MVLDKLISSRVFLRMLNIGIRGGTIFGRFLLIMFLAKFLPEAEMGKFGIFVATILLCVLVISLEFNKYMYGELFANDAKLRAKILGSHVKAVAALYLLSVPLLYLIFELGFIDWRYIAYFYSITFFVLVSMELQSLLTVLGNQLFSSLVYFAQTSSWVFFVIPVFYFFPKYRSLDFIYFSWLLGAVLSILVAFFFLKQRNIHVDLRGMGGKWIWCGIKKSAIFLLSSIMLKLLLTVDRYAMEYYSTPELVGVYVFYISVVMGIFNFLEPAVFSFIYPKLLRFYKESNYESYRSAHKELIYTTFIGVFLLGVFLLYAVPYVIDMLNLDAYKENLDSLWLVVLAAAVFMLGYIPHYALFSRGQFNWLSYSNAAALVSFSFSVYFLSIGSAIDLLAISLLIAFSISGSVKFFGAYILQSGQEHG